MKSPREPALLRRVATPSRRSPWRCLVFVFAFVLTRAAKADQPAAQAVATETTTEARQELPQAGENPISGLDSATFQLGFNGALGPFKRTQPEFELDPVIPIGITQRLTLIATLVLPFKGIPDITNRSGTEWGFGDVNPTFLMAIQFGEFFLGPGVNLVAPTASDAVIGQGKWQLGPALAFIWFTKLIVAGFQATQAYSLGGDGSRPDVSNFKLQPLFFLNLPEGTFLVTSPLIQHDWKQSDWIVPVGGGVGKLVQLGTQAANVNLQVFWNAAAPAVGPTWRVQFQLQLLFPERAKH